MIFDRKIFFDTIRDHPFDGSLTQGQVEGMSTILDTFEVACANWDLRWLAYPMATTYHETGATMQPIEEYGKGSGKEYGKPDPKTGKAYYGRGFVQLTWADNYKRVDKELSFEEEESCYLHPELQLTAKYAAPTMFLGMSEGWFRKGADGEPETLEKYFNETKDDAFNAREIINGDKKRVPSWSNGVSIGNLIAGYHDGFLKALKAARVPEPISQDNFYSILNNVRAELDLLERLYSQQGGVNGQRSEPSSVARTASKLVTASKGTGANS